MNFFNNPYFYGFLYKIYQIKRRKGTDHVQKVAKKKKEGEEEKRGEIDKF